jgi:hypothetical protein
MISSSLIRGTDDDTVLGSNLGIFLFFTREKIYLIDNLALPLFITAHLIIEARSRCKIAGSIISKHKRSFRCCIDKTKH